MKTTIMFVSDSEPLAGAPVRQPGGDQLLVTDNEGKVDFELELGIHTFEVQVGENWVERTVQRQGHSPLFVVNVNEPVRQVTTLNTLQIDLSNLVGDRFVFETVLGRGGMGVVVKAIDRMLNRPVAIKMLSDELHENEEAQQIFLVEARNLATLSHPNLVAIHDILNVGGRVLMVFEYVLGENVEKKIKQRGRLDQKEVLRIAIQLTRCVSYLHEHDLIHRDLKPANIIMQADGTLKLIDFGLARSLNDLYVRGTRVRGTPAYMAPEQIQGIHLTAATDLYQIGISTYEMLTGKLPFSSGDMAYAHVHLEPPPLRDRQSDVDPELAGLVMRCLAKNGKHRPASAEELLESLQSIYAKLVNQESDPFQDVLHPGPPTRTASQTNRAVVAEAAADDEIEEVLDSRSNRTVFMMTGIGFVALLVAAGFLLFPQTGEQSRESAQTASALLGEAAATTATGAVIGEPPEAAPMKASIAVAQDVLRLGIATAGGQAAGRASAELADAQQAAAEQPEAPKPRARREDEPTKAATPKPAREEAKQPLFAPPAERPGSDLLSVDEVDSNPLLPVNP